MVRGLSVDSKKAIVYLSTDGLRTIRIIKNPADWMVCGLFVYRLVCSGDSPLNWTLYYFKPKWYRMQVHSGAELVSNWNRVGGRLPNKAGYSLPKYLQWTTKFYSSNADKIILFVRSADIRAVNTRLEMRRMRVRYGSELVGPWFNLKSGPHYNEAAPNVSHWCCLVRVWTGLDM